MSVLVFGRRVTALEIWDYYTSKTGRRWAVVAIGEGSQIVTHVLCEEIRISA